jgi:predicted membrane-bound mannosyltransferase
LLKPNGPWGKRENSREKRSLTSLGVPFWVLPLLFVVLVAVGVSVLFHSSFLTHPRGVWDSLGTYYHYIIRASGEGSEGQHAYPWYHYFRLLFWWQSGRGPLWTEALIGGLALVGLTASILGRGMPTDRVKMARFLSIYTVVLTLVYSAMSYKTPWCAVGFLHGMILLAGVGTAVLIRVVPRWWLKTLVVGGLAVAAVHLGWQAHRAAFVDFEDLNNPYVYAHTTSDVPRLVGQLRRFADFQDQTRPLHVQVICPDDDYWPLPWYMRDFSAVGWFAQMPQGTPAEVIIIQPGEAMESALKKYLYVDPPPGQRPIYVPAFEIQDEWLLRPGVGLQVYVRWDLWSAYPGG